MSSKRKSGEQTASNPETTSETGLNCIIVENESPSFPVEIHSDEIVSAFKRGIKKEKPNYLSSIDANNLILKLVPEGGKTKAGLFSSSLEVLDDELVKFSTYFLENSADDLIHIVVELPEQAEGTPVKHRRPLEKWSTYIVADGESVTLPLTIRDMLENVKFKPYPRTDSSSLFNVKAGDQITTRSLGQKPKFFGEGYQGHEFFVTEQVMELWKELESESEHSIKRCLSGPMSVGKSYIACSLPPKHMHMGDRSSTLQTPETLMTALRKMMLQSWSVL
ncbi:hypothetical protein BGX21_002028 [Mortierella sp. AD011]|nr:hypothetical protein BGX20_004112 [Mortierella sp. AD010]KAF9401328.1 hypothetical protein BGX21_002028 [Mortierella sp. AD011]